MAYDAASKILFIHVPKTAGSSIEHSMFRLFLSGVENKKLSPATNTNTKTLNEHLHTSIDSYSYDNPLSDHFIFSSVRDPYERFYSFYLSHMIAKRRVEPTSFSMSSFEDFIVKDYTGYIKSKTSKRKGGIKSRCSDKNFISWASSEKLIDVKLCENVYQKYFSLPSFQSKAPKVRFLLFSNIQEEYRKMLDYLIRTKMCEVRGGALSLEDFEASFVLASNKAKIDSKQQKAGKTLSTRCRAPGKQRVSAPHPFDVIAAPKRDNRSARRVADYLNQGLKLVNIAPMRGRNLSDSKAATRNSQLIGEDAALKLYTKKARKAFERYNSKDIEFYNKLKNMSFEERFEANLSYDDLVKDV